MQKPSHRHVPGLLAAEQVTWQIIGMMKTPLAPLKQTETGEGSLHSVRLGARATDRTLRGGLVGSVGLGNSRGHAATQVSSHHAAGRVNAQQVRLWAAPRAR